MDEMRNFGYCENCGNTITSEDEEYYVTDDGKVFCSVECCLEHFGVTKIEV
jgi:hypothetical protein